MKIHWIRILLGFGIVSALLCTPAAALGSNMEKAEVHAMRRVPCAGGQASTSHKGVLSALTGSGGRGNECIEYQLVTAKVTYAIRPRVAILLMLGDDVYVRLAGDELLLQTAAVPKDVHCSVLSMRLRGKMEENDSREEAHEQQDWGQARTCLSGSGDVIACPQESAAFR